ncbi:MAG: alpha/beta hydrolase, partial [Isosphaeraceae bacterium]
MSLRTVIGFTLLIFLPPIQPATAADRLSIQTLKARLAAKPTGEDARELALAIRAWFGNNRMGQPAVESGANPKVAGLETAWAIQAPAAESVAIVTSDSRTLPLVKIGDTHLFAATHAFPEGTAFRWTYVVDKQWEMKKGDLEVYTDQPELAARPGVPKGKLIHHRPWRSQIYPGTRREWWVYVPAQYKDDQPACVMVFQDGGSYTSFVPTVFDNLVAKGEMPVTVGVFINPGSGPGEGGRGQRSVEYDTLSDRYARFLLEEILPEVEKTVKLRHDADSRAIAGISSGGICSWTVAWERPNEFHKVLSWVGSFTNIASGKTL